MKKVWSSCAVFDSDGHWIWGEEDLLRQRYGKTCRVRIINSATAGAGRSLRSGTASSLEHAMDLSDVRMERVARIRTAIANGCYHVSSEDLAQKLIGAMLGGPR